MLDVDIRHLTETHLTGVPLAPGIAVGRACFHEWQRPASDSAPQLDIDRETERLHHALRWLADQRSELAQKAEARVGHEHAEVFEAHRLILEDESFQSELEHAIREDSCSAQQAIVTVLDLYSAQFAAAESAYLQQRAADMDEIQQDLLGYLNRTNACRRCKEAVGCSIEHCRLGNDHILIAREITACLPIETDNHTAGFIVEKGGPNSHAVILARALQRPVVGNIHDVIESIPEQAEILVDGYRGVVVLNPTGETRARYRAPSASRSRAPGGSVSVPGLAVMGNIGQSEDVDAVLAAGADGIGLYRTEIEMLLAGRLLSEAEQAEHYAKVVAAMAGKPVCIRLLDIGADKVAPWLEPVLKGDGRVGLRGARFLLAHPDILHEQARALARASVHGPVRVLYPMITGVEQFLALRALFEQATTDLQQAGLQHGVMFEVPAACLAAESLMRIADFGCIGTNDLIQYLFAADRTDSDPASESAYESSGVLWELISDVARIAKDAGKPMTLCGELAGNAALTGRIMASGLNAVSTSPSHVAAVRAAARAN